MRSLRSMFRALAAAIGAFTSTGAPAQSIPPDSLLGIRIGQPLESQMSECSKDEKGQYELGYQRGDKACWVHGNYGKEVRLPLKIVADTRIGFDSDPRVRTRDGIVVEIDAYADGRQAREVLRYLTRLYGKPHSSETYERDSRVFGLSKATAHTWRGNGASMHFDPRASNEKTRIRAVNDAWEALDAREQEQRREERLRRGGV